MVNIDKKLMIKKWVKVIDNWFIYNSKWLVYLIFREFL